MTPEAEAAVMHLQAEDAKPPGNTRSWTNARGSSSFRESGCGPQQPREARSQPRRKAPSAGWAEASGRQTAHQSPPETETRILRDRGSAVNGSGGRPLVPGCTSGRA